MRRKIVDTGVISLNNKGVIKYIYNSFGNDNILICGGLVDFYWINYKSLSDFDFIIRTQSILNFFEMSNPLENVMGHNFVLKKRNSNKFIKDFYQGLVFDIPVDIFFIDDWKKERKYAHVDGEKIGINNKINIDDPYFRLQILKDHLAYSIQENYSDIEKEWILKKQEIAKIKIPIYERFLNEKWKGR